MTRFLLTPESVAIFLNPAASAPAPAPAPASAHGPATINTPAFTAALASATAT